MSIINNLHIKYSFIDKKDIELKGLNGLKALAIIIILIYHFVPDKLPGGFLAVDLFLVITGYLMTDKILKSYVVIPSNIIFKRISRLFPTLLFMILVLSCVMLTTNRVWFMNEWENIVFSLFFLSNFWLILNKNDYFDNFNIASPVKHLWYIALDIQFFIFYSFILSKLKNRKHLKKFLIILTIISVLSIILIYHFGGKNNISIIYYSPLTRFYALTIGSIYAVYFSTDKIKKSNNIIAYILLIAVIVSMKFVDVNNEFLYKYALVSVYSIIFGYIVIKLSKSNLLACLNSIGKKSYQLYVWHYAIIVLTTPFEEYARPNIFHILCRLILIIIICTILNILSKRIKNILNILMIIYIIVSLLFVKKDLISYRLINENEVGTKILQIDVNKVDVNKIVENTNINKVKQGEYEQILLIGDSLSINIAHAFGNVFSNLTVDGQVGRQMSDAIKVASDYKKFNNSKTAVIIMLGTNGEIRLGDIEKIKNKFKNADIYFININVPRPWLYKVNETLGIAKNIYDVKVIDWYSVSNGHDEYFKADKIHVNETGAEELIKLIIDSLDRNLKEPSKDIKPKIYERPIKKKERNN
ncbi:acyltransferase family protein [Caviibacter abscessus]|uniref:acyltransferase family protein n=1 Tax=Caviibacter abscessus TaxID=1766719 RepID=UPI000832CCF9|nr:acyltransferase family protein [Caviibacter abscessus]